MPQLDITSSRVVALAEKIGDAPLSAFEREDGTIVIVFCNKGKLFFEPEPEPAPTVRHVIHTKSEAEEAVAALPANPKRKEKYHAAHLPK